MKTLLAVLLVSRIAAAQDAPIDVDAPAPPIPAAPAPAPVAAPTPVIVETIATPLFVDPQHHRLELDLEMFGTGAYTSRDGSSLSEFRLDRGEAGAIVGLGKSFGTELRLESIRSAAQGGELGIDGDSIVVRVKRAQVFGDYDNDQLHLHGALGVTPDPWIMALETDYPLRPLSATASERVLGWPTSDLAGLGRVAYGPVRLSVSVGNGEGLDYPERNNGKTTTGVIEAVPLATDAARVRLSAVARDGSIGPARVRDRRFGGAATVWTPVVSAGGEVVQAYGIGDRGDLEALALAGWAEARVEQFSIAARFTTVGYADNGGRASSVGGAIAFEPWRGANEVMIKPLRKNPSAIGNARIWLAVDHTTSSGAAMPIPGADAGAATTLLLIVSTTAPFTID